VKLLRVGEIGKEIPTVIDKNGKYRNLSSYIKDLIPETINFENLEKLKKFDLENLDEMNLKVDNLGSQNLKVVLE
jgi:hypothetical protein